MLRFKKKPEMMEEAENSMISENILSIILVFIIVFIIAFVLEGIYPSIIAYPDIKQTFIENGIYDSGHRFSIKETVSLTMPITSQEKIFIVSLFCTAFGTLTAIIHCRCIEGRSFGSMGMRKRKAVPHYLFGIFIGILLMTSIVLLSVLCGVNSISFCNNADYGKILLFLGGFLVQGMSEEVIFRGYLMNSIGATQKIYLAITVSAVAFSLAHAMNPGFGILIFINLTLFGIFASLYIICFDDIWGACAIHSIWNFTQGNFYGISVSGSGNYESVFRTSSESRYKILTGGDFGIEGSIFTTAVLLTAIFLVMIKINKNQSADEKKDG